ncbi:hypothetical protein Tco_0478190 [Tanacetum coccineum]
MGYERWDILDTECDHNLWRIVQQRGTVKDGWERCERKYNCYHHHVSLDEHVLYKGDKEEESKKEEEHHAQKQSSSLQNSLVELKKKAYTKVLTVALALKTTSYGVKLVMPPLILLSWSLQLWSKSYLSESPEFCSICLQDIVVLTTLMGMCFAFCCCENESDQAMTLKDFDRLLKTENKTGEVEKVYGMMAGLHTDNGGAGVSDAAAEFALMGISPKWKEVFQELEQVDKIALCLQELNIGLGFKELTWEDEVFDLSDLESMYPAEPVGRSDKSSDSETHASCDSSLKTKTKTKTKDFPPAVDIQTLPESDVEDPNSTTGSPSFSCSENVKSPRTICNKSGMNNRNAYSVPCKSKAASVPAGSRNSPASVTAGGSDPAASRNRPAANSADRPHPAGWDYFMLLDIAGWLVSATSHLVSAGSLHSCWCNKVSAA